MQTTVYIYTHRLPDQGHSLMSPTMGTSDKGRRDGRPEHQVTIAPPWSTHGQDWALTAVMRGHRGLGGPCGLRIVTNYSF